jgi:hypothetical protein
MRKTEEGEVKNIWVKSNILIVTVLLGTIAGADGVLIF